MRKQSLFAVFLLLFSLFTQAQTLVVKTGGVASTSATVLTGKSFILDLSLTIPTGCNEVNVAIPIPAGVNYNTVATPGWTVTSAGPTLMIEKTGAPGTFNVQINFTLPYGVLCPSPAFSFQADISYDGGCSDVPVMSNPVTVTPLINKDWNLSSHLLTNPSDLCIGGYAKFRVFIPSVGKCGTFNLDDPMVDFTVGGNATVIGVFNSTYGSIPYTTTFVSGNTEVHFDIPDLVVTQFRYYYIVLQFPCGVYTAGTVPYFSSLEGIDPCGATFSATESPAKMLTLTNSCCTVGNGNLSFVKDIYSFPGQFCPEGCYDNRFTIDFDNTSNPTTYSGLVIEDVIPASAVIDEFMTDTYNTYLDVPGNSIQFEYKVGGIWSTRIITATPAPGELLPNYQVYGTTGINNLGLTMPAVIEEVKWTFLNPVVAWGDFIRIFMRFKLDATAMGVMTNTATATTSSPPIMLVDSDDKTVEDCGPALQAHKRVYPALSPFSNNTSIYANPGDKVRYRLTINNWGSGDLLNGMLTDNLPAQFDFCGNVNYYYGFNFSAPTATLLSPPAAIGGTFNYDLGMHQVTFNNFTLPESCDTALNEYFIIEFDVEIQAGTYAGVYNNNFGFTGSNYTGSKNSNIASVVVNDFYRLEAELFVDCDRQGTFADTSAAVQPGDAVYYKYLITNVGNVAVDNVRIFNMQPESGDQTIGVCLPRGSMYAIDYVSPPIALSGSVAALGSSNTAGCMTDICNLTGFGPFNPTQSSLKWESNPVVNPGDVLEFVVEGQASILGTTGQFAYNEFGYCARRLDIGANTAPATSNLASVQIDTVSCATSQDSLDCKRLLERFSSVQVQQNECCWQLEITNSNMDLLTGVVLDLTGGVLYSYLNALGGWSINASSTSTHLVLDPPTGFIPVGTDMPIIEFCLSNITSSPQLLSGYYLIGDEVVCPFDQFLDCELPGDDSDCLNIVMDSIYCQDTSFFYEFCIENQPTNTFSVGSFVLLPSGSATFDNFTLPAGVSVTPMGSAYLFSLSTALAPGSTLCTFSMEVDNVVPGQLIELPINAHQEMMAPFYTCCFDSVNVAQTIVPDYCTPDCEELIISSLTPAQTGDSMSVNCCFDLNLTNAYGASDFDQVQVNALTPGVTITSFISNAGWTATQTGLQSVDWYPTSFVPLGISMPGTFCLSGATNPKEIEIVWMLGQEVICRDTLMEECTPSGTDCVSFAEPQLVCEGDLMTLNFTVTNNSGFTANQVTIASASPLIYEELTVSLAPGATSGLLSIDMSSYGLVPGDLYCLTIGLHAINDIGFSTQCCQGETLCLVVPSCQGEDCGCGEWEHLTLATKNQFFKPKPIDCEEPFNIACKRQYFINGLYNCSGDCPAVTYDVVITGPDGFNNSFSTSGSLGIPIYFANPGPYSIAVEVHCGDQICKCNILVNVKCKICPPPYKPIGDTYAHSLKQNLDANFGDETGLQTQYWLYDREPAVMRSFLQFDLSEIPSDAIINSASLSLYATKKESGPGSTHSILGDGNNDFVLKRVMPGGDNVWTEASLNWNNQPMLVNGTDSTDQLILNGARQRRDYQDVDVTAMVQQMLLDGNNGWGLRLNNESDPAFRSLGFCSREFPLELRQPRLEVCYDIPTDLATEPKLALDIQLYPNPTGGQVTMLLSDAPSVDLQLLCYDVQGRKLRELNWPKGLKKQAIDFSSLASGIYLMKLMDKEQLISVERMVKQ